ncbi:NmrA family NAD(P)-binding protein [Streptomyces sp. NPDC017254]|uniref:NmrA family NAD(P)-binding protein n=1 Tax=unclassified Streptomyces TaxID=2593676 RepID=UPI0037A89530
MTILVAGATGTVGRQVVAALREAGAPVRALTRRPGAATFGPGVEVVGGDLTDASSLESALRGVSAVHLINFGGDGYAPLQNGGELSATIEAAGVRRVTMLAGWSESTLEPAVRASGLAWTLVAPTEIMANALEWADEVRAGRIERPYGDSRTAMVHEGDIGAVAATALLNEGHAGAEYLLTGPERISLREKIAALGTAAGRQVEFAELTPDEARAAMRKQGVPEHMIDFQLEVFADPPAAYNTPNGVVEKVTGRPARTFAQWARENAATFR